MAGAGTVPPQVHRLPRIEGADKGYKRRRHFRDFVEESSPGHRVISATPVKKHDGGCGVELGGSAKQHGQAIRPSSRLQRELVRPGGLIEAARIAPGERAGDQATKGVASCNALHSAALLQRREAS